MGDSNGWLKRSEERFEGRRQRKRRTERLLRKNRGREKVKEKARTWQRGKEKQKKGAKERKKEKESSDQWPVCMMASLSSSWREMSQCTRKMPVDMSLSVSVVIQSTCSRALLMQYGLHSDRRSVVSFHHSTLPHSFSSRAASPFPDVRMMTFNCLVQSVDHQRVEKKKKREKTWVENVWEWEEN